MNAVKAERESAGGMLSDVDTSGGGFRNLTRTLVVLAAVLGLAACAVNPATQPAPAPQTEALPELMHQAETAAAAGDKAKARDLYQAASKNDPTSKAPWVKLAEGYFEEGDYGNAVLAAQEVLHRDNTDSVGAGILAVSGLRISTAALTVLRQQNNINPGTRGEAETLTRNLRELLGEQILVPRPVEAAAPPPQRRARVAASASAATGTSGTSANRAPAANAAPATSTTAASRGSNPFDKLK
jgi:tetratricopeptide (TPR) repeat protein